MPAHLTAVARIAAAVLHDRAERRVVLGKQAKAVANRGGLGELGNRPGGLVGDRHLAELHLPA